MTKINVDLRFGKRSLCKVLDGEDGHKYLIPFEEYEDVNAKFNAILDAQEDDMYEQLENLLDCQYERLEGQEVLVILQSEVIGDI